MAPTSKVILLLLLSTLALSQASSKGDTVTERILQGFKDVTDMSENLRIATEKITDLNAGKVGNIIGQGLTVVRAQISHGIEKMNEHLPSGPLSDDDAVLVLDAITTFVKAHQALLNVLIGKHGLLTLYPFITPIRVTLVNLEAVIDEFALDLTSFIPTRESDTHDQFDFLRTTLRDAIRTYSYDGSLFLASESTKTYTTTERILQGFQAVTTMSDSLRVATENINYFNAGKQGIIIATGFTGIISKIAEGTVRVDRVSDSPLSDDDAKLVVEALTTFVDVHKALLNVVIGKHGLLTLVPFFGPIRLALVQLEAVIDTFALDLIALIPTQKPAADTQFSSLSVTLTKAKDTYAQPLASESETKTYTTTERILQGFQTVTTMSDSLRVATENINYFNAGKQGIIIATGFTGIISKIAEGTVRVDRVSDSPLSDDDAKLVVEALTTFVDVHKALLNVVIGKHGLLTLVPFFGPIRLALVELEVVIDTFALDLIALIPTQEPAAEAQFSSLSVTLTNAENTYGQVILASVAQS